MRVRSLVVALLVASPVLASEGYLRQPTLNGDTVVFAAEGDLWSASVKGGIARRLTSHPGFESSPAIAPDGSLREPGSVIQHKVYPDLDHSATVNGSLADSTPFVKKAFAGEAIAGNCPAAG